MSYRQEAAAIEALGLVAIAAAFGYFATLVLKRYEILRSIALDVDREVREALNESLMDDDETRILNAVNDRLIRAGMWTSSLPPRSRAPIEGQLRVAHEVTMHLFSLAEDSRVIPQVHLQAALSAAREVIAPLLLPPPFLYRGAGRPRSYPTPNLFAAIMLRHEAPAAALDEALTQYIEGLPEALEDHYPPNQ